MLERGIRPEEVNPEVIYGFGMRLGMLITERLVREDRTPGLRMSSIGKPCERQIWYEINQPELGEPLRAETYMKFLYGDIIEELMLFLAELAGHEVTGRQDEQDIQGIKGHKDANIDGTVVDVKSASQYSFKKFANGSLALDDPFGYIDQLQSYLCAGQTDDKVTDKDRAAFLVVDKVLGKICLDIHKKSDKDYPAMFDRKKEMIKGDIPERGFEAVPHQGSGNMKLGTNCSYCAFKKECWPGLRTFAYANVGPISLTKVVKEPNVFEITEMPR